jgi:DNA modification methylase
MGSFYRSQHELVYVFKNGTAPHINNFNLGEKGRYRTNVWNYPGANTGPDRREALEIHPTVKPCAMFVDAMLDCSRRGGIVLDCFGGSGVSVISAERTGRMARVMELDPLYVDLIVRRWQSLTDNPATHAGTGVTFDEMASTPKKERQ